MSSAFLCPTSWMSPRQLFAKWIFIWSKRPKKFMSGKWHRYFSNRHVYKYSFDFLVVCAVVLALLMSSRVQTHGIARPEWRGKAECLTCGTSSCRHLFYTSDELLRDWHFESIAARQLLLANNSCCDDTSVVLRLSPHTPNGLPNWSMNAADSFG